MRHELLTILFIRSSYKIRKINLPFLYYQLLKFGVILFFLIFVGLVFLTWQLSVQNTELKDQVLSLKSQKKDAFLYGHVEPKKQKPPVKSTPQVQAKQNPVVTFDEIDQKIINVRDFSVNNSKTQLQVGFDLVNDSGNNSQAEGYLHVLFMDSMNADARVSTFPQGCKVDKQFNAINYKTGDSFAIKYFKKVQFNLDPPDFSIKFAVIRVYSTDGQIIYQNIKSIDNDN